MKKKVTWFLLLSTSLVLGSCSWFNNAADVYDESEVSSTNHASSSVDASASQSSSQAESEASSGMSESSVSEEVSALGVVDYFPMREGYQAVFAGDGNEFAGFTRTYDFIRDDFLTMRTATGGTTTLEVVAITPDRAEVLVTKPETYSHEELTYDMITQTGEPVKTLIEGPIEVGHTWDSDGRQREITGIDVPVETTTGSYEALEVTEYGEDSERREYYAPDVGLVYVADESTDPDATYLVTQILAQLSFEGWGETITFYYPNGENRFEQVTDTIQMTTNDKMALKFTQLFQGGNSADQQLMGKSVEINTIDVNSQNPGQGKTVNIDFNEHIRKLADDPQGKAKLDAIMASIQQYYNADEIRPTIEGEYMVIDGLVTLTAEKPLYLVPEDVYPY